MSELEIIKRKPYLYDLYRLSGRTDILNFLDWLRISKYRIVFLKRKCEQYRDTNRFLFLVFRGIYSHYMIKYGVDIPAKTKIGPGFIVRHVGGIAVHSDAVIGKNVEVLQGVTIGFERRGKRLGSPVIGDNVWIGSNAIIVGHVTVGDDVLIAPGAFVNFDVPSNSIVIGNPGKIIHKENAVEGYVINTLDI